MQIQLPDGLSSANYILKFQKTLLYLWCTKRKKPDRNKGQEFRKLHADNVYLGQSTQAIGMTLKVQLAS